MIKKTILSTLIIMVLWLSACQDQQQDQQQPSLYLNNRQPLLTKPYMELPLGAIRAEGWLKEQLVRQKNGLTGNLDEVYEQVVGNRNGWLGGDGDVWERGPYWIDGLLPLAYILDDQELIDKTTPWIEWTLNSQQPNGYFGPDTDRDYEPGLQRDNAHDWWPKMVMLKVLKQYYSATGDDRVIDLMRGYFRYQLAELPEKPLGHWTFWGMKRGGDNLAVVYWLYNLTGEEFLLELAELIHEQTYDWAGAFTGGELREQWNLHCVNVAQGMKEPGIWYQQAKDPRLAEAIRQGLQDLRQVHGMPHGMYGADEMLHSNNPTQGSEFCTAVEMMFSMESILPVTGDPVFADHLERVAFNALPAQATDDFDARQYYQQANQVQVSRHPRNFNTPHEGTDILFGQLTGYPCCTSNMHQGWPKFTQNLWYATADRGLAALVYAPSTVTAKVGDGAEVQFEAKTGYPFEETIRFIYHSPDEEKVNFPLYLRIPGWCRDASVHIGQRFWETLEAGKTIRIDREWTDGDTLVMNLPMEIRTSRWHENSVAIEHGPLVYALKIGEDWKRVENNDRYGAYYYEIEPTTPWNYGLIESFVEDPADHFEVRRYGLEPGTYPWNLDNAPVEIRTKGVEIPFWTLYDGSAGPLPFSPQYQMETGQPVSLTLVPYGCTGLRISEFPVVRKH